MNDFEDPYLVCSVKLNYLDNKNCVTKTVSQQKTSLQLYRNEFKDIILKIDVGKTNLSYTLRDIVIHGKFVKEGKATIKLTNPNLHIMVSNCPPSKLSLFLKTLSAKLQRLQAEKPISAKQRLLSEKPKSIEEISPLTAVDVSLLNRRKMAKLSSTSGAPQTPKSHKRKIEEVGQESPKSSLQKRPVVYRPVQTQVLTLEQKSVLSAVMSGKNIFFTGSAGTGKSFLLKRILGALAPESTFATASTGVAACQIGGITLHAFAGIGSGTASLQQCIQQALRKGKVQQWRKCQHLIVDEISMVDGEIFQKLEAIARVVRNNDKPFGGIQLILTGDFLQLPPVCKTGETRKFCFQTSAWKKCVDLNIELTQVRRQKDPEFIQILQAIRRGRCGPEIYEKLKATSQHKIDKDGIMATRLSTHKDDVSFINETQLTKLSGESHVFHAIDSESGMTEFFNHHCSVGNKIELKIGAQVMLTKNLDVQRGLVNGARGVVTGFESGNSHHIDVVYERRNKRSNRSLPIVKFICGVEEVVKYEKWSIRAAGGSLHVRKMLPLKLAWALSIHKSQGMTLDCVEVSLLRVFESGQAYVALSRARSLNGLRVLDIEPSNIRADPNVLAFYAQLQQNRMHQRASLETFL